MYKPEIRRFIVENFMFGQAEEGLADEASLLENGLIDSTGVLELVAFLEQRYGIAVADEELLPDNLDSVENLNSFISTKLASASAGRPVGQ